MTGDPPPTTAHRCGNPRTTVRPPNGRLRHHLSARRPRAAGRYRPDRPHCTLGYQLGLWGVFVAEFLLRAYVARFQAHFWRKNWWQVIFLLVSFLRFFRALKALRFWRVARFGRVLSAGVRGSRSAEKLLSNRQAWLLAVTAIVILAASQLLYIFADCPNYFDALYEAALATVTGSDFSTDTIFVRVLHVVLAFFSVVVFATLAGTLGAFFLRRDPATEDAASPEPNHTTPLLKNLRQ